MTCPHGCTCTDCAAEQTRREAAALGLRHRHRGGNVPSADTDTDTDTRCAQPADVCDLCDGRRCLEAPPSVRRHPEVLAHFLSLPRSTTP